MITIVLGNDPEIEEHAAYTVRFTSLLAYRETFFQRTPGTVVITRPSDNADNIQCLCNTRFMIQFTEQNQPFFDNTDCAFRLLQHSVAKKDKCPGGVLGISKFARNT